ncbi:MAG: ankyrin repeat domain-containing protein [Nannocystales bacterium]
MKKSDILSYPSARAWSRCGWSALLAVTLCACGAEQKPNDAQADLIRATVEQDLDQLRAALFAGANVDTHSPDLGGGPPLVHLASEHPSFAQTLIGAGADLDQTRSDGNTALHVAASSGNLPVVGALLYAGANPNLQNEAGHSVISEAVASGRLAVVKALIMMGADPTLAGGPEANRLPFDRILGTDAPPGDISADRAGIARLLLQHAPPQKSRLDAFLSEVAARPPAPNLCAVGRQLLAAGATRGPKTDAFLTGCSDNECSVLALPGYPNPYSVLGTVTSGPAPQKGQKERSSANFSTETPEPPVTGMTWLITQNPNADSITFKVKVDRSGAKDPDLFDGEVLGNKTTTSNPTYGVNEKKLYIANPAGATASFVVTACGVLAP